MKIKSKVKSNSKAPMGKLKNDKLSTRVWHSREYYLMLLPAVVYVIVWRYLPMYGIQIAFKDYNMWLGITKSEWVGLKHFVNFINSYAFKNLLANTLILSLYQLVVGFPIPIIVALILNELKGGYKKFAQTVLYAPHFISTVVLVGIMKVLFSPSMGVVNHILESLGLERIYFMGEAGLFRHMYVWSGIWQGMGWSAIIYLGALASVDPALHEAAELDGASRIQRILHINIPTILPTIIITLIMKIGSIVTVGYEKVYLMQNDMILSTSEVISTYVYKRGLVNNNYSFATAVGLMENIVNIILLLIANKISKTVSETSFF